MKRPATLLPLTLILFFIASCTTADPSAVARAVEATLTAALTPTPVVIVVTVPGLSLPTVTPGFALAAATPTLAEAVASAPAPSDTPVPALTPTATSTPPPLGQLLFQDDFSQRTVWNQAEDSIVRVALADGQLSITLKAKDRFRFIYNLTRRAGDFYAVVTTAAAQCAFRDRHGLLFRVQDESHYYQFEVDCDGRYRLSKAMDGALTPLQDWTPHAAIQQNGGAVNELGVRALGDSLEVLVNGQSLITLADSTYAEGGFGLYAGSGVSESYTAAFDDLRVWEIEP
jgi:hypothetical protein